MRMGKDGRRSGIESSIGNTPLVLIRSLSEATGCKIWGKAEVGFFFSFFHVPILSVFEDSVFVRSLVWGWKDFFLSIYVLFPGKESGEWQF